MAASDSSERGRPRRAGGLVFSVIANRSHGAGFRSMRPGDAKVTRPQVQGRPARRILTGLGFAAISSSTRLCPDMESYTADIVFWRSEEHTSELQSLMRNSYAVFCWKK